MRTVKGEIAVKGIVLCVAGAKGAIGSSLALSVFGFQAGKGYEKYLVTAGISGFPNSKNIAFAGWDVKSGTVFDEIVQNELTTDFQFIHDHAQDLKRIKVLPAPEGTSNQKVDRLRADFRALAAAYPEFQQILVNVLPTSEHRLHRGSFDEILRSEQHMPDLPYVLAAVQEGIPILNFTPNIIEIPGIVDEAVRRGIPLAGRDGKTGQTYFKMAFASALRARSLYVQGWYSTNILGNNDGFNLSDEKKAKSKLENKTKMLSKVLGYDPQSHIVRIDYYPPRKDAKEAWDVIDIEGMFGEKMGIRINLQGKDSVLAVPIILDVARILAVAKEKRIAGVLHDLSFFFKTSIDEKPPYRYEDQLFALQNFLGKLA